MGRPKSGATSATPLPNNSGTNSGNTSASATNSTSHNSPLASSSGKIMTHIGPNATSTTSSVDVKVKDMLKELHHLVHQVQEERNRGEHNLTNISKTHEKILQEQKVSPYYKTKLRGLYTTAMQDAASEADLLQKALDSINQIKATREQHTGDQPKMIMRRGVLMNRLQLLAQSLTLWIGKPGEKPPPLCGAIAAETTYICKPTDTVAARVKSQEGEENWILAEVVSYSPVTGRYEVDDIDAEEGKERHTLSRRRVVPLPHWKANPETDPEALFPSEALVLALYPQTTCFYRALISESPKMPQDDYLVLFEDVSYANGYSPPLNVAQRYVIASKTL